MTSSKLTLHDLPDIELHVEVGVLAGGGGRGEEDGHETEQRPGPAAKPAGHHHSPPAQLHQTEMVVF